MKNMYCAVVFWGLTCIGCGSLFISNVEASNSLEKSQMVTSTKTVVLARPTDTYYPLAMEISQQESLSLMNEIQEAIDQDPVYIIWVVHPKHLSENRLIEVGEALQEHPSNISIGIITGTDAVSAKKLWQGKLSHKNIFTTVSEPRDKIFSNFPTDDIKRVSIENIQHALQNTNYLAFSGGGGPSFWRIDKKKTYFRPEDIPQLSSIIISSGGCQTAQIWRDNSIALKFIDQGAVGYAGFIFSPAPYNLFGFPDDFPFKLSWRQFPVGHIISLQNKGLFQGFAKFPFFYFFGDPRIYFNEKAPYQLISDYIENGIRHLEYQLDQTGIVPIKITNGAQYGFIKANGITSATEHDFFYNNFIQIMTIQKDKYVLLNTDQKRIKLSLYSHPPWYWFMIDPLLDSLDHVLFYIPHTTGLVFDILIICLVLIITFWFCYRFKISIKQHLLAFVSISAGITLLYAMYVLFRLEQISIVNIPVPFNMITLAVTFILVGCGTLIFLNTKKWKGTLSAILIATFPSWAVAMFWLGGLIVINLASIVKGLKSPIYNYNLGLMPLITSIFYIALTFCMLTLLKKTIQKK